jgi:tRNA (guanine-N7-)-methyltransferase
VGRRALPRIDPSLDLAQHLFELSSLPSPLDGHAVGLPECSGLRCPPDASQYQPEAQARDQASTPSLALRAGIEQATVANRLPSGSRPLEIEIGSGKGLFLFNESAARPDTDFLGVEISKKYCRFAAFRLAQAGRTNARMIRGDGIALLRERLLPHSVAAVHIYFPDPWWKARHRRRRVVQDDTIPSIARVLVPGGRFHFWTDVEEYFETGCGAITTTGLFRGPLPDQPGTAADALESGDRYLTHFERRMLLHDHDVFRARFERLA